MLITIIEFRHVYNNLLLATSGVVVGVVEEEVVAVPVPFPLSPPPTLLLPFPPAPPAATAAALAPLPASLFELLLRSLRRI